MHPACTGSRRSVKLRGKVIAEAADRQKRIAGFDQDVFSTSSVLCIGAGGIVSQIAPTLVRKGIGRITLIDDDFVEPSNLNRQRFYTKDIGRNKALALARNLQPECIAATEICGYAYRLQEAIARGIDLRCGIAICGVDNNPARVAASRFFRGCGVAVIFTAVSRNGDHGYVFVQEPNGACIGCLFPDIASDERFPCPGTPAIADILQAVGALSVYALDTVLMERPRTWNYRTVTFSRADSDGGSIVPIRDGCGMCGDRHGTDEECKNNVKEQPDNGEMEKE